MVKQISPLLFEITDEIQSAHGITVEIDANHCNGISLVIHTSTARNVAALKLDVFDGLVQALVWDAATGADGDVTTAVPLLEMSHVTPA